MKKRKSKETEPKPSQSSKDIVKDPPPLHSCSYCEKTFRLLCRLKRHVKHHTKPYSCSVCPKKFGQKILWTKHEMKYHGRDPSQYSKDPPPLHSCPYCEKTFSFLGKFNKHVKTHQPQKPFKCPKTNCEKSFRIKRFLTKHISRMHDNIRPFPCSICAEEGKKAEFISEKELKRHKFPVHDRENHSFSCNLCSGSAKYASLGNLNTHLKRIHKIDPWNCSKCDQKFRFYLQLKCHEAEHKINDGLDAEKQISSSTTTSVSSSSSHSRSKTTAQIQLEMQNASKKVKCSQKNETNAQIIKKAKNKNKNKSNNNNNNNNNAETAQSEQVNHFDFSTVQIKQEPLSDNELFIIHDTYQGMKKRKMKKVKIKKEKDCEINEEMNDKKREKKKRKRKEDEQFKLTHSQSKKRKLMNYIENVNEASSGGSTTNQQMSSSSSSLNKNKMLILPKSEVDEKENYRSASSKSVKTCECSCGKLYSSPARYKKHRERRGHPPKRQFLAK